MPSTNGLKILVVEDNQMFRDLALRMLPDCQKHGALTVKEAMKHFKETSPDITFLDIGLPDGNGLDLLKEMRKVHPDAFIVMLTQSRIASDIDAALKFGAAGYIAKPFSKQEIDAYIQHFCTKTPVERTSNHTDRLKKGNHSGQDLQR